MAFGGEEMNYNKLLEEIAKKYNTTAENVDKEIRHAIKFSGSDEQPEVFISRLVEKTKKQLSEN